jgi:dephospho-CoA kinase
MVPAPTASMATIRGEVERVQSGDGPRAEDRGQHAPPHRLIVSPSHRPSRPIIIGLAGGVGSGKSEAGGILADLGCVLTDSDAEARAVLDLPEVKGQLVSWWGGGILGPEGRVQRGAIAKIVFADPEQRRRLEGLVHPLVRRSREELIRRAAAQGARAVVIDAPLLFEAGVDAECDAVIFIDAPRASRLERVRTGRGWDEAELDRREAAQMPLEEKRRRAHEVVMNDGTRGALRGALSAALARILERARAKRPGGLA